AFEKDNRLPALAQEEGGGGAHDAAADDDYVGRAHLSASATVAIGSGFTGAWPRSLPTSGSGTPRDAARISAAADPQKRPWQRPMPIRESALARLSSGAPLAVATVRIS